VLAISNNPQIHQIQTLLRAVTVAMDLKPS